MHSVESMPKGYGTSALCGCITKTVREGDGGDTGEKNQNATCPCIYLHVDVVQERDLHAQDRKRVGSVDPTWEVCVKDKVLSEELDK